MPKTTEHKKQTIIKQELFDEIANSLYDNLNWVSGSLDIGRDKFDDAIKKAHEYGAKHERQRLLNELEEMKSGVEQKDDLFVEEKAGYRIALDDVKRFLTNE